MAGDILAGGHGPADDSGGGGGGAALVLWDCGSALYDSYELTAFKRQLDAAVLACRSISMPHLPAAVQPAAGHRNKRARRLPAMLRRFFSKALLRLRLPASVRGARRHHDRYHGYGHGDYSATGSPWSGALTSIPEESGGSPEESGGSPEAAAASSPVVAGRSALRRVQSERFIGSKTASPMVALDVVL